MEYKCKMHPDRKLKMSLANLMWGKSCPYCTQKAKHTIEEIRDNFTKRGYILLSETYQNAHTPLFYQCPKHKDKKLHVRYSDFLHYGHGCKYCARDSMRGEGHFAWKGGTSPIDQYLRDHLKKWKKEILKSHNHKCFITGKHSYKLQVHHLYPFNKIRDQVLKECNLEYKNAISNYSNEQLHSLVEKILLLHEDIVGVPLLPSVHKEFHKQYRWDFTEEDFYNFKENYLTRTRQ